MAVVWFCPECWSEVSEADATCPACGAVLKGGRERSFVQKLIAALRHPEPETAVRAAHALGALRATEAVPALIETLGRSDDPYLLEAVAGALGELEATETVPALRSVLRSSYLVARIAAAKALGRLGTPEALTALEEARQDQSESVRQAVEEQLAERRNLAPSS
jgi:HEAT repeat protein